MVHTCRLAQMVSRGDSKRSCQLKKFSGHARTPGRSCPGVDFEGPTRLPRNPCVCRIRPAAGAQDTPDTPDTSTSPVAAGRSQARRLCCSLSDAPMRSLSDAPMRKEPVACGNPLQRTWPG